MALLRVMLSGRMSLVIPQGFLHALWSAVPSFRGYRQQDAQEFLCEVLDKLADEMESAEETPSTSKKRPRLDRPPSIADRSEAAVRDFVGELFSGELRSRVSCGHCGRQSTTREPFSDLSLEFPAQYQDMKLTSLNLAEEECGLDEMLAHFTAKEDLGPVYACAGCSEESTEEGSGRSRRSRQASEQASTNRREAVKELRLSRLPRLLRLHLKRFRWGGRNQRDKLSLHVRFPETLQMAPYIADDAQPCQDTQYRLCGVIEHHGRGFNSGHYTSYCWNSQGHFWMHCNDARLQLCTLPDVLEAQAYILFYRQESGPAVVRSPGKRLRSSVSESDFRSEEEGGRRRSARLH